MGDAMRACRRQGGRLAAVLGTLLLPGAAFGDCGQFPEHVRVPTGSGPISLSMGDFDGDGARDLAVANSGTNDVSILLGNGDGTFASQMRFDIANGPQCVAIEDLDGDGDLALAISGVDGVSTLFNQCGECRADLDLDGSLTIFDFLTFLSLFEDGDAAADFDGDGELTIFDFLAFQTAFDAGCP